MFSRNQGVTKQINLPLNIHVEKIQILDAPEKHWVRALIKRGDHKHLSQGFEAKDNIGKGDSYNQPLTKFMLDQTTKHWAPKKCSIELQMSTKSIKANFLKHSIFDLDMSKYLNDEYDGK
jgi:hypothetical protein